MYMVESGDLVLEVTEPAYGLSGGTKRSFSLYGITKGKGEL